MFAAHTFYRCNQKFGIRLHRKADEAGYIGGFLADCQRLHVPGFRIDHCALQQFCLLLIAEVRAQFRKSLQHNVINFIINHQRLL